MKRASRKALGERLSVFVASTFIDEVQAELSSAFATTLASGGNPISELEERVSRGGHFDVLLFSLDRAMGASQIDGLPECVRALATYSVGSDHIDLEAAARRGLAVFNTPGVLGDSVAENAIFLMLGAARRATESIELLRSRNWTGWTPTQLVGVELAGRTLGIVGMGDIGERVALRATGLDVFAGEPKVDRRYFDLPNVFMVPHIGSSTLEARLGMGRILIEGITRWQSGTEAVNRIA
jgi:lactate dehydrogenase-like 2-hydroxyacid dehydrogenase